MSESKPRREKKNISEAESTTIECRRCGVCCTRHQAFVSPVDIERIITYLGITIDDWDRLYDDTRWEYSEYRLIKHISGGCAFLRFVNGLATCVIHEVKPACCSSWKPGPDRPECQEGLRIRQELR